VNVTPILDANWTLASTFPRFAHAPICEITIPTEEDRQIAFYGPDGTFNPCVLSVDFAHEDVYPAGVLANSVGHNPLVGFTGPVLLINGANDTIYCPYNQPCQTTLNQLQVLYPNASKFDTYVLEDSGHVVALHYTAPLAFQYAHNWLNQLF
jgi:pimeloyl-ACP methyl ester carboxylesterase